MLTICSRTGPPRTPGVCQTYCHDAGIVDDVATSAYLLIVIPVGRARRAIDGAHRPPPGRRTMGALDCYPTVMRTISRYTRKAIAYVTVVQESIQMGTATRGGRAVLSGSIPSAAPARLQSHGLRDGLERSPSSPDRKEGSVALRFLSGDSGTENEGSTTTGCTSTIGRRAPSD